jgi:hypothetical protein
VTTVAPGDGGSRSQGTQKKVQGCDRMCKDVQGTLEAKWLARALYPLIADCTLLLASVGDGGALANEWWQTNMEAGADGFEGGT